MKLAIIGSHEITEQTLVFSKIGSIVDEFCPKLKEIVLEGKYLDSKRKKTRPMPGVATLAEAWAEVQGVKCRIFPINPEKFASGVILNNAIMLEYVDAVLYFYDGKEYSVWNMLGAAVKEQKPVHGFTFDLKKMNKEEKPVEGFPVRRRRGK